MRKGTSHYKLSNSEKQTPKSPIVLGLSLCYSQALPESLADEGFLKYSEIHKQPLQCSSLISMP